MLTRAALAPVLALVLLSGCAAGSEGADTPDTPVAVEAPASSAAASPSPSSAAATGTPTPSTPAVRTIAVTYAGGQVTGTEGREEVPLGEEVVLRITSDVDEQVHVHGYDLEEELPAGVPVDIPVPATVPGVFEVELHESGKVLFQLRVS